MCKVQTALCLNCFSTRANHSGAVEWIDRTAGLQWSNAIVVLGSTRMAQLCEGGRLAWKRTAILGLNPAACTDLL